MRYRILSLSILMLLAMATFAYAIEWGDNLENALDRAKKYGKPLMIDFYATWCGPCKKMNDETFKDGKIGNLSKRFICVRIDADKNRDLLAGYGIEGYPTVIFMDKDKIILNKILGYRNASDFIAIMQGVLDNIDSIWKNKRIAKNEPVEEEKKEADSKPPESKKEDNSPFNLSGIIYEPEDAVAVINNAFVKVGDDIEGAKVVDITETKVVLSYENSKIVLELE